MAVDFYGTMKFISSFVVVILNGVLQCCISILIKKNYALQENYVYGQREEKEEPHAMLNLAQDRK